MVLRRVSSVGAMTRIAPLTDADRSEWERLWQAYLDFYAHPLPSEVTDDAFRRLVAGATAHAALARDDDGRAIGFVHWITHPSTWSRRPYCYLEDLFVADGARGLGAGRALIAHVREWAEDTGCEKVYWITDEGNARARALYDDVATATGFVPYEIALR